MGYQIHPVKADITDETANRVWDTNYQNTTGRPIIVMTSALFTVTDNTVRCRLNCYIGASSPAGSWVLAVGYEAQAGMSNVSCFLPIWFIVPAGWYYRIRSNMVIAPNTASKSIWQEAEL